MEKVKSKSKVKMNNSNNPFANMRRRDVRGSNGILHSALNIKLPLGTTSLMRQSISAVARASEIDRQEGRTGLYTHTIQASKFSPSANVLEDVEHAYMVYQTFAEGSIARLLLNAHALGFRFFPKSSAASSFLSASKIKTEQEKLQESISNQSLKLESLSVLSLYDSLSTGVRGKGDDTQIDPLVTRFYTAFTGKPLAKNNETEEKEFCIKLATVIVDSFKTWKDFTADPVATFGLLVPVFEQHNIYTKLASALEQLHVDSTAEGPLSYRTIVYDKSLPVLDITMPVDSLLMALSARYAQEANSLGEKPVAYVKNAITTTNANGLGWFLNKGFTLLPDEKISNEELAKFIGCDRSTPSFQALLKEFQKISVPTLFNDVGLSDLRASVQGRIDSFTSNHIARLDSSIEMLEKSLPAIDLLLEDFQSHTAIINHIEETSGLQAVLHSFKETLDLGLNAAKLLSGKATSLIDTPTIIQSIELYEKCLDVIRYVQGCVNSINAAIKKQQLPNKPITTPEEWTDLISLPSLSDPIESIEKDREKTVAEYTSINNEYTALFNELKKSFNLTYETSIIGLETKYKSQAFKSKHPALATPNLVAFREILSRITSAIFKGSDSLRAVALNAIYDAGICPNKNELREQLNDRKYIVYMSPYTQDKRPRKFLEVSNTDHNLVDLIYSVMENETITESDRDNLGFVARTILLNGLPDQIPTSAILTRTVKENCDIRYRHLLSMDSIEKNVAIVILNSSYQSKLNGLRYKLNKTKFYFTRTLTPYVDNRLVYVPKQTAWKIPTQFAEGRYKSILESEYISWDSEGVINVEKTAFNLVKAKSLNPMDVLSFMRELPHRFFMATGLPSSNESTAITINSGQLAVARKLKGLVPLALNRENKPLIRIINNIFNGGKVSPPSIQFERNYEIIDNQLVEIKSDRRVIFQLPAALTSEVSAGQWAPTHLIGIDPGVYGFGISLLSIQDGQVLDSGFVSVRSLKQFVVKKETHRTITTPRQKYTSKFSHHLSNAADAAVGDICHIIERLMHDFNALPVFEMVSDDGKDLSAQVWNRVVSLYTWGDNDAQNSARKSHWFGATHWDTPLLRTPPLEKKAKPFIGFPGVKVSSYGNSQACSCCGRNVVETLRELFKTEKQLTLHASTAVLPNGTVQFENPDPLTAAERKSKGLPPHWVPVGDRSFNGLSPHSEVGRDLIVMAQRSIRRSPEFKRTTQGTESVYKCPYIDCGVEMNAEANASINVVKKFHQQLDVSPASV